MFGVWLLGRRSPKALRTLIVGFLAQRLFSKVFGGGTRMPERVYRAELAWICVMGGMSGKCVCKSWQVSHGGCSCRAPFIGIVCSVDTCQCQSEILRLLTTILVPVVFLIWTRSCLINIPEFWRVGLSGSSSHIKRADTHRGVFAIAHCGSLSSYSHPRTAGARTRNVEALKRDRTWRLHNSKPSRASCYCLRVRGSV